MDTTVDTIVDTTADTTVGTTVDTIVNTAVDTTVETAVATAPVVTALLVLAARDADAEPLLVAGLLFSARSAGPTTSVIAADLALTVGLACVHGVDVLHRDHVRVSGIHRVEHVHQGGAAAGHPDLQVPRLGRVPAAGGEEREERQQQRRT